MILPGCVGGLFLALIVQPLFASMIIFIIHVEGVTVSETKGDPPIGGDLYGPPSIFLWFQQVKSGAGIRHISNFVRSIEAVENVGQLIRMLRLDASFGTIGEEFFESAVNERDNHAGSVTHEVTAVNEKY